MGTPFKRMQAQHMVLGQLYTNDIRDKHILDAMGRLPRAPFLPAALQGAAYTDSELAMGNGRHLIAPLTMARLFDLVEIKQGERVLVIGTLSGYVAAIAALLGGHVTATDTDAALLEEARDHLQHLNLPIDLQKVANLADAYAPSAPYDVIILPGAVDYLPDALGVQLGAGGRLACVRNIAQRPGMQGGLGKVLLVKRIDHKLQYRDYFDASANLLPGFQNETPDDNWKLVFSN